MRFGSDWLPAYSRRIQPGFVVSYRTMMDHRDADGHLYPRGTLCRALRSASGELCLLFWKGGAIGQLVAVWLPVWAGLCGIEPNVCDPMKENQAFVNEVIAGVDARVGRELREEAAAEAKERRHREDSILSELGLQVEADLEAPALDSSSEQELEDLTPEQIRQSVDEPRGEP